MASSLIMTSEETTDKRNTKNTTIGEEMKSKRFTCKKNNLKIAGNTSGSVSMNPDKKRAIEVAGKEVTGKMIEWAKGIMSEAEKEIMSETEKEILSEAEKGIMRESGTTNVLKSEIKTGGAAEVNRTGAKPE